MSITNLKNGFNICLKLPISNDIQDVKIMIETEEVEEDPIVGYVLTALELEQFRSGQKPKSIWTQEINGKEEFMVSVPEKEKVFCLFVNRSDNPIAVWWKMFLC